MLSDTFPYLAGIVLSLLFSYIPGLNSKWEALDGNIKRLIMLGLILVVAGAYYGLSCTSWAADLGITVACTEAGLKEVVKAFIACLLANQAAYQITKG